MGLPQTIYQDLIAASFAGMIGASFPSHASLKRKEEKGRHYWYATWRDGERIRSRYLGKETPELLAAIEDAKIRKHVSAQRKDMVKALLGMGYPRPDQAMCGILRSLADNGFFRLRGVLIGSLAFQCYFPMFGRTSFGGGLAHRTQDIDVAMFRSISIAVQDSMDKPFGKALEAFSDSRFERILDLDNRPSFSWIDRKAGISVDLLMPFEPPEDRDRHSLPSVGADAMNAKFLDFLIHGEAQAAILSGDGIPVNVPEPGRYGIHKLLLAPLRPELVKRLKDMKQAAQLLGFLIENDTARTVALFREAFDRGPHWRRNLLASLSARAFPEKIRKELLGAVPKKFRMRQ